MGRGPVTRLFILLAGVSLTSVALAQMEEIIVEAPRLYAEIGNPEVTYPGGRPTPGGRYEVVLQGRVNAEGLDLSKPDDEAAFRERVRSVAFDICDRIGQLYPKTRPETPECARNAEEAVAEQVQAMVDAARARAAEAGH
jgi:UrcA family protein